MSLENFFKKNKEKNRKEKKEKFEDRIKKLKEIYTPKQKPIIEGEDLEKYLEKIKNKISIEKKLKEKYVITINPVTKVKEKEKNKEKEYFIIKITVKNKENGLVFSREFKLDIEETRKVLLSKSKKTFKEKLNKIKLIIEEPKIEEEGLRPYTTFLPKKIYKKIIAIAFSNLMEAFKTEILQNKLF